MPRDMFAVFKLRGLCGAVVWGSCVGKLCGAVVLGSCVGQLYGAILPVGLETLGYNSTLGCRWTNISYEWILDNQNFMAWQP